MGFDDSYYTDAEMLEAARFEVEKDCVYGGPTHEDHEVRFVGHRNAVLVLETDHNDIIEASFNSTDVAAVHSLGTWALSGIADRALFHAETDDGYITRVEFTYDREVGCWRASVGPANEVRPMHCVVTTGDRYKVRVAFAMPTGGETATIRAINPRQWAEWSNVRSVTNVRRMTDLGRE